MASWTFLDATSPNWLVEVWHVGLAVPAGTAGLKHRASSQYSLEPEDGAKLRALVNIEERTSLLGHDSINVNCEFDSRYNAISQSPES